MQAEPRKAVCPHCNIVFAQAEDTVVVGGRAYHPSCFRELGHTMERRRQLSEFFRENRGQVAIHVAPHGIRR